MHFFQPEDANATSFNIFLVSRRELTDRLFRESICDARFILKKLHDLLHSEILFDSAQKGHFVVILKDDKRHCWLQQGRITCYISNGAMNFLREFLTSV